MRFGKKRAHDLHLFYNVDSQKGTHAMVWLLGVNRNDCLCASILYCSVPIILNFGCKIMEKKLITQIFNLYFFFYRVNVYKYNSSIIQYIRCYELVASLEIMFKIVFRIIRGEVTTQPPHFLKQKSSKICHKYSLYSSKDIFL